MSDEKPYLGADEQHLRACHIRWTKRLHRNPLDPNYQDGWGIQQCGGCRYFIPLAGVFADDWGGCTNAASSFDQRVMFEHDGCDAFDPASDGWFAGTYFEDQRLDVDEEGNLIDPKTGEKVDLASLE